MAQHFLKSAAARDLRLMRVMRMTETEAETMFKNLRWPETKGEPVCPACGTVEPCDCRRPNGAPLALQGLQGRFQHHVWNNLRQSQAALIRLPRRHCDLLQ